MRRVIDFVCDRVRQRAVLIPPGYSWNFVLMVDTAMVLFLVASIMQRGRADLPASGIAALLALAPLLLFFLAGVRFLPGLVWATSFAATTVLLFATSTPVAGDVAPVLLVVALGCTAALGPMLVGTLALGSAVALLVVAAGMHRLDELALYLGMVAMGWLMGILTRIQAQLIVKQQEMQADLAEHAVADERRRIAREVHDVIAHSLSVTMLHVTGARHALQRDRDIDDAVDALTDAERLGRQAMADIRRTVGLLDAGPAKMAPEPGIADIPDLVDDFVQAGLPVTLRSQGDPNRVSAAVGLALYRITQESLANIAKHAPESKATVQLVVSPSAAVLSVVNTVPVAVGATRASRDGRGLAGMRQRVELLGGVIDAGPSGNEWSVRAEIPLSDPIPPTRRCPL
ncbi:sensor histidine kinase [Mycobacterium branderi]|uniref:histidine kinase n=1 Tax=Mycobacterium branderi TaxID=43348 RepID=A0AA91LZL8_9MYCO|nr:histidine kinase [Mycobacterium branderi]MCV7233815.1 two-component sensor histidine kinase [Mycobacterium branderi]ORA39648.1 two-component sensor histidine kinase [Mycobacterium branderi]